MLSWSNNGYKFTLGIGSLALVGMMAERWKGVVPVWAVMLIALLPLVIFVFVHPHEAPPRLVRYSHAFASIWYIAVAVLLLVVLLSGPNLPRGWVIYPLFVSAGFVPCVIVLYRVAFGRYVVPEEFPPKGDV